MSTLNCYQFRKKGKARNFHKVKTWCFWLKRLYNTCTHNIFVEAQFEISDDESDTEYDRTKKNNIKEGGNTGNGQVAEPGIETVDLPGDDASQGFVSYSNE